MRSASTDSKRSPGQQQNALSDFWVECRDSALSPPWRQLRVINNLVLSVLLCSQLTLTSPTPLSKTEAPRREWGGETRTGSHTCFKDSTMQTDSLKNLPDSCAELECYRSRARLSSAVFNRHSLSTSMSDLAPRLSHEIFREVLTDHSLPTT